MLQWNNFNHVRASEWTVWESGHGFDGFGPQENGGGMCEKPGGRAALAPNEGIAGTRTCQNSLGALGQRGSRVSHVWSVAFTASEMMTQNWRIRIHRE